MKRNKLICLSSSAAAIAASYKTQYIYIYPVRWPKLLGSARSGSTALSYQNCVITPGWRLMRTWYHMCFHTYDEKNK